MAFTRPTLSELTTRIHTELTTRLGVQPLRRGALSVLSRVLAGSVHLIYGQLDWLSRQLFPSTADLPALLERGGLYGMTRNPATYAVAGLILNGTAGTVVPSGTEWVSGDGLSYFSASDATLALSGLGTVDATCSTAGSIGTVVSGATMTAVTPISGLQALATVNGSRVDGADEESVESFRERVVAREVSPPKTGTAADYVSWAREVTGVTRAWATRGESGPGTVVVRFVRDGDGDGAASIPSAGEVAEVQAAIDAHASVTADVVVAAPQTLPVNYVVTITPSTAALRAAVEVELADLHRRTSPGGVVYHSAMMAALSRVPGLTDYVISSPAGDVTPAYYQIPHLGTVSVS